MLKVEERGKSWGFCVRILPFNIDTYTGKGKFFKVITLPNGKSELIFSLNERVVDNLFKSAKLEIYSNDRASKLIWKGEWTKNKKMMLELDNKEVRPYTIKITAVRNDGKEWGAEIEFNSGKRIERVLFSKRRTDYKVVIGEDASESEKWAAHNKINGAMGFRKQHGDIEGYWAVHTFYQFMPPSEFYDEHPEYYSLIDGKRIHERAQLCLTNPDVLDIITERLKQAIKENPSNLIYSVSQNDWKNPCQCNKCQAIVDDEGGQSGIMEQSAYQSRGGEFAELRAYLISKLLWDAESNVDDVIGDFTYGYYG